MGASYVQTNQPFAVKTPLGDHVLLLESFEGEEGVSRPFRFTLDMLSHDAAIDPDALLGQPACITLALEDDSERVIHGRISRFAQLGTKNEMTVYRAELVPWLWFLSLARDCRIFQQLTVPEIVEQVFTRLGFTDFDRKRLVGTYPEREYCVQYRETHLAFVSRLLEDEGISYFFEHTPEKHVLVLADAPGAVQPAWNKTSAEVTAPGSGRQEDVVQELWSEHVVQSGRFTLSSYDWLKPSHELRSTAGDDGTEVHDFLGAFVEHEDGDRYARLHLEACEARRQMVRGSSTCRAFQSGARFTLQRHYRADVNQPYHLLTVRHSGRNGSDFGGHVEAASYDNAFEAIPAAVPFRPERVTPRPRIRGTQSAVVVGKPGEEIWTDPNGRVKLHFHWDREGERDGNDSCWVRCSFAWAGKGWGQFSVPRIGQEVLVEFMDGDPDKPVVVGRVYNAEQTPPCDPGGKGGVVSGMRSKTHKGGGANWVEMHDTTGDELLDVNAHYNMHTTVGHDDVQAVTNDRKITVDGTHTERIKKATNITVTEGTFEHRVEAGTATYHVKGLVTEEFLNAQHTTVTNEVVITGNKGVGVFGHVEGVGVEGTGKGVTIKGTPDIYAEGSSEVTIKSPHVAIGDGEILITGTKITLSAGSGTIVLDATGVTINGAIVKIN